MRSLSFEVKNNRNWGMINLNVLYKMEWKIRESHNILSDPSNTIGENTIII